MQKAVVIENVGKPAVVVDRPIPEPDENHLLVRVTATSLNPVDQKTRDEGLFFKQASQVIGHELAGEVTKLGRSVDRTRFVIGDHIFAQADFVPGHIQTDTGTLQQYALVNVRFAAKVSDAGLTDEEATTIPVCAIASFIALFHSTGMGLPIPPAVHETSSVPVGLEHKAILIIGGGSNCGRFAIQFAKLVGFSKIVTIASANSFAQLKQLGATHLVDRHIGFDLIIQQVRAITGDDLIYAFDAVNTGSMQDIGLFALSNTKKGCLVTLNRPSTQDSRAAIPPQQTGRHERKMTFGFSALYPEEAAIFWETIARWVRLGAIKPLQFSTADGFDIARINSILDGYRDGQGQKVVLKL
ncbi:hypothetical protein Plec18170_005949 [Paecilomyces lecythidis]